MLPAPFHQRPEFFQFFLLDGIAVIIVRKNTGFHFFDITFEPADRDFYLGKLQAARWFLRWELPRTGPMLDLLDSLDTTTLDMRDAWF